MNNRLTLFRRGFDRFQSWKFWLPMVILFMIFGAVSFFQRFDSDWRISWGEIQSVTPVHSLRSGQSFFEGYANTSK